MNSLKLVNYVQIHSKFYNHFVLILKFGGSVPVGLFASVFFFLVLKESSSWFLPITAGFRKLFQQLMTTSQINFFSNLNDFLNIF